MLKNLIINNIVLIDKAELNFDFGLTILTGETGSGKSILIDALSLALGMRSNSKLLRNGEKQGNVIATFEIQNNQKCKELLKEQAIEINDELVLRRVLFEDGKSKAFINDIPVNQSFLNLIGEQLIEIHGQHDQRGLLNPAFHKDILDEYGNLKFQRNLVENIFNKLNITKNNYNNIVNQQDNIEKEIDYLTHIIKEITDLNIADNEEEELDKKRKNLINKEKITKILENVKNAIDGQNSINKQISLAQNYFNKGIVYGNNLLENDKNAFEDIIDELEKTAIEFNEVLNKIDNIYNNIGYDEFSLNDIEERLFAIRGLARKLNITSDLFNSLKISLEEKLYKLQNQNIEISSLEEEFKKLEKEYFFEADKLSKQRSVVAISLEKEVLNELIPLKMDKVRFKIEIKRLSEENYQKTGIDNVKFVVATNIGTDLDDLSKIASGGELSRFMLAFKVVLSKISSVPTLIFDEIDTGVSGAVADSIGERLKILGKNLQVFVITHLSQVASKGTFHFKIDKINDENTTKTVITLLGEKERINEIAQMLSNNNVTDEAIRMAEKLLG